MCERELLQCERCGVVSQEVKSRFLGRVASALLAWPCVSTLRVKASDKAHMYDFHVLSFAVSESNPPGKSDMQVRYVGISIAS
jgi:hypothetical protein